MVCPYVDDGPGKAVVRAAEDVFGKPDLYKKAHGFVADVASGAVMPLKYDDSTGFDGQQYPSAYSIVPLKLKKGGWEYNIGKGWAK